jgi:Fe-S-cluster containining protein
MNDSDPRDAWYADGLRFECSRCGDCCRGPGYIWLSTGEIDRLAGHLDMSVDAFVRRYLRTVTGRVALVDNTEGDCVFWADGCTVYAERPTQCRTFPFWTQNVVRPESWARTVRACRGAGEGRLYSLGRIEQLCGGKGQTAPDRAAETDSE